MKLTKVYPKPVGSPVTNKESYEYLKKKNKMLSVLVNVLDLDIED